METNTPQESTMTSAYFYAGAPNIPGTGMPRNVTGNCPHRHRTPEAAQRCIDAADRSIKAGHGPNAYADQIVMVHAGADRFTLDEYEAR